MRFPSLVWRVARVLAGLADTLWGFARLFDEGMAYSRATGYNSNKLNFMSIPEPGAGPRLSGGARFFGMDADCTTIPLPDVYLFLRCCAIMTCLGRWVLRAVSLSLGGGGRTAATGTQIVSPPASVRWPPPPRVVRRSNRQRPPAAAAVGNPYTKPLRA